ncbi:DUF222 domain-containing protein [Promicromonospora sp. NPDC090134]|uniref:HNH endonuclease signature motif containing protein n=1 Tax=Promicromonospora sp. NPDC090134 TaxID=3364408 RepID=UPI00382B8B41
MVLPILAGGSCRWVKCAVVVGSVRRETVSPSLHQGSATTGGLFEVLCTDLIPGRFVARLFYTVVVFNLVLGSWFSVCGRTRGVTAVVGEMVQSVCSGAGPSREVADVVADLERIVDELIDVGGPEALDTQERFGVGVGAVADGLTVLSPALRKALHRLDVLRVSWLPRIEAHGLWAADGSRTFPAWLSRREGVRFGTASRDVKAGRRLAAHLPATLAGALAGRVGPEQLRAMIDKAPTSDLRAEALATEVLVDPDVTELEVIGGADPGGGDGDGDSGGDSGGDSDGGSETAGGRPEGTLMTREELLLTHVELNTPDGFRRIVDRFADQADPDADERGYRIAKEREHLELAKTLDGFHIKGFLTDEHGHALSAALGSVMGKPAPGDERTATQRRAQALADLARTALDNGRTGSGAAVRPQISVLVSLGEMERLVARVADGAAAGAEVRGVPAGTGDAGSVRSGRAFDSVPPTLTGDGRDSVIPRSLFRRLACDSAITRVVFGSDGAVLDVGRAHRTVTGQMRRAVIARDRQCVYPSCDQPPSRCEVHHAVRHWADGGETSVANGALLCYHHHDLVDTTGVTMRWREGVGGWAFVDRHGRAIADPGAPAGSDTRLGAGVPPDRAARP